MSSIQFNGQVTVNGDVEIYDNGSIKITNNQVNVDIKNLQNFIEDNLKYSSNKEEYLESAKILGSSKNKSKIKDAYNKFKDMVKESGKAVILNGLSTIVLEAIRKAVLG